MKNFGYELSLKQARSHLASALAQREELDRKIDQLRKLIRLTGELNGEDLEQIEEWVADEGIRRMGITEATRAALRENSDKLLTVAELREYMAAHGFDFSGQVSPLASLTTVVKRLFAKKEVAEITREDRKRAYRWIVDDPPTPQRSHRAGKMLTSGE